MNEKAINNIISEIAKKEGTEVKEVRKEMEKAIMAGYLNSNEKWNTVFNEDTIPSPEEFIIEIAKMMVII
ncbi:MAG: hypothetical protein HFJ09_08395 [Lachnospiraceae bacterium]|nr:hypothetical protein [Lachnospiraceae bacterium]